MRFHKLALSTIGVLAISAFSGHNGVVYAEDAAAAAETPIEEAATPYQPPENAESFKFEAEVHRMLDIVVNSLYQNKDVFLRELISNACDALDKIRFMGITKPEMMEDKAELEIRIEYDAEEKTLTVRDSGIGMTHDDMISNLGTVARSGTTKFLEALEDGMADMAMIGQFGVGFYSSFLVADRVSVASKHPSSDKQYIWESLNGQSEFVVFEDPRGNSLGRGTEITLHLKEDALEYADPIRLKELATHYSEFVTHPIHLRTTSTAEVPVEEDETDEDVEEGGDEEKKEDDEFEVSDEEDADDEEKEVKEPKMETVITHNWDEVNTNPAIWSRDKDEITDEEYQTFWQVVSKESNTNASTWSHFNAEGNINFKSILYLPESQPQNFRFGSNEPPKGGLKLYVRKVLISDEFELMPAYLSFIKGVVDSEDLPLNVNRETLQESKIIQVIKKKLVRKAIEMVRNLSKQKVEEEDDDTAEAEIDADGNVIEDSSPKEKKEHPYISWYKQFGASIKFGCIEDEPNRGKLAKLLRFHSSLGEKEDLISLEEYVERMQDWQKDIYVIAGSEMEELEKSQFMEKFNEKNIEVLYLVDPIDEYMMQHMRDFDGKKFVHITSENVKINDEDEDLIKRRQKAYTKQFKPLTKWLKNLYGANVMKISISKRLGTAPAIVSSSEYGASANMERIMRAQAFQNQQDFMSRSMKILEINPRHPFISKLLEGCPPEEEEEGAEPFKVSNDLIDSAWMLYDMALLNGGFPIENTDAHTRRMTRVLKSQMGVESLALEPEIDPPVEEEEAPDAPDMGDFEGLNMEDFDLDDFDA